MTDRVHPSSKPKTGTAAPATPTVNPTATAAKSQLHNPPNRPYRPQQRPRPRHHPRHRRGCLCRCCIWTTLLVLLILLIAATASAALYFFYRPHRPTFAVAALRLSRLRLAAAPDSSAAHLSANLSLVVSAHNPNSKVTFFYEPFTVSILSHDVLLANSSFPAFTHFTKNTTQIRVVASNSQDLDTESFTALNSDLKNKKSVPLKVTLDTKVKVKMGALQSNKVGIRVACEGIQGVVPKGKTPTVASVANAECKVDLRVKIWKFTF